MKIIKNRTCSIPSEDTGFTLINKALVEVEENETTEYLKYRALLDLYNLGHEPRNLSRFCDNQRPIIFNFDLWHKLGVTQIIKNYDHTKKIIITKFDI